MLTLRFEAVNYPTLTRLGALSERNSHSRSHEKLGNFEIKFVNNLTLSWTVLNC